MQSLGLLQLSFTRLALKVGLIQQQGLAALQFPASESWFCVWKNATHLQHTMAKPRRGRGTISQQSSVTIKRRVLTRHHMPNERGGCRPRQGD